MYLLEESPTWKEMEMTAWFLAVSSPPPLPPVTGSSMGRPTSSSTERVQTLCFTRKDTWNMFSTVFPKDSGSITNSK